MKKFMILLLWLNFNGIKPAISQLDIISPPDPYNAYAITFQDKAYVVRTNNTYFSSYDGNTFLPFNFPAVGGSRLKYKPFPRYKNTDMVQFNSSIYLILGNDASARYLYRFDGHSFFLVSLPGTPASDPIVFEDNLYLLVQVGSEVKLFSYNGVSALEISLPDTLPEYGYEYALHVTGQYLYISGFSGSGSPLDPNILKRFDGSGFLTIPILFEYYGRMEEILGIDGTEEIFIKIWDSRILNFDGSTIREVYNGGGDFISSFILWDDVLYFQSTLGDNDIYRYNGTTNIPLVLPDGAIPVFSSNCVVYNDTLYVPAELPDGSSYIYTFDGTSYARSFEFTETPVSPVASIREDSYIIIPKPGRGSSAFEYNGSIYNEILAPEEKYITNFLTSTSCFHLWNVSHASPDVVFEIAKEDKGCTGPVTVIPEFFWDYDRIDLWLHGKYRDWCWTDIFWDWEINPICPVPETCPDPIFGVSLTDLQGKEMWNEHFEEPFKIQFPFEDKQPYTLTLSSVTDKVEEKLLIFDDDLVAKGLSAINISMLPQKDYFLLKAETSQNEPVPFRMSLLNNKEEVIWEEKFTAPLEKEIKAFVNQPGATLQFSSLPTEMKKLEDFGIKEVKIYPNPFQGRILVEITTDGKEVPAEISITDLRGKICREHKVIAPTQKAIEMFDQKPGPYILSVSIGTTKVSKQIKLEY